MKRFILSIVAMTMFCGITLADTYTLVMGDKWGAEDADLTEWTQDGFKFIPAMGANAKDKIPVYKSKNKEVRFYALNTLTIEAPEGSDPITKMVFTLSKQGREEQAVVTPSVGEIETQTVGNLTVTWNGNAASVTLTVGEKNTLHMEDIAEGSGQFNFTQVEIATGGSVVELPKDSETEFYMCNATDANGVLGDWTQGNLHFTAERGADETVNDPALKNGDEARFYAGNSFTISTVDGAKLASVEFVLSAQGLQQQAAVSPSAGTMTQKTDSNALWEGEADSITFAIGANEYGSNSEKKGQFDFTKIVIAYAPQGTGVSETEAVAEGRTEYYTLQGVKCAPSAPGIYICRRGSKTSAIVIR